MLMVLFLNARFNIFPPAYFSRRRPKWERAWCRGAVPDGSLLPPPLSPPPLHAPPPPASSARWWTPATRKNKSPN